MTSNDGNQMPGDQPGNQPGDGPAYGQQGSYDQPAYGQQGSYGQPAYGQSGAPLGPPTPPDTIQRAVLLMRVGALLSLLGLVATFLFQGQVRDEVERSLRDSGAAVTQDTVDAAVLLGTVIGVLLGLVGVGLWLWMAWANGRGRSWARVVASVLYGLYVVSFLFSLAQPQPILSRALGVASLVLGGVIIYLLWQRSSSDYYRAMSAPRR